MFTKKELERICIYVQKVNKGEALDGDDVDDVAKALNEFNGNN